jgi:hypothetical protein
LLINISFSKTIIKTLVELKTMETKPNQVYLTGKEGEEFDLELAASWTKNHRSKHPDLAHSHFFGKDILQKILDQDDCVGIRIHHAYSEDGKKHVILTGATSDGKDMIGKAAEKTPLTKGEMKAVKPEIKFMVAQQAMPCPGSPGCPTNALTSP